MLFEERLGLFSVLTLEKRKVLSELMEEEIVLDDCEEIELDDWDEELDEIEEEEILDSLLSFESNEDRLYPERSELSSLATGSGSLIGMIGFATGFLARFFSFFGLYFGSSRFSRRSP